MPGRLCTLQRAASAPPRALHPHSGASRSPGRPSHTPGSSRAQASLFELIIAANYLDVTPLTDLTCKCVAEMIRGKTPEEIRRHFNIRNDFTPEEEEQIRRENEWCEEA